MISLVLIMFKSCLLFNREQMLLLQLLCTKHRHILKSKKGVMNTATRLMLCYAIAAMMCYSGSSSAPKQVKTRDLRRSIEELENKTVCILDRLSKIEADYSEIQNDIDMLKTNICVIVAMLDKLGTRINSSEKIVSFLVCAKSLSTSVVANNIEASGEEKMDRKEIDQPSSNSDNIQRLFEDDTTHRIDHTKWIRLEWGHPDNGEDNDLS